MKDKYALLTGKFQGRNDEKVRKSAPAKIY